MRDKSTVPDNNADEDNDDEDDAESSKPSWRRIASERAAAAAAATDRHPSSSREGGENKMDSEKINQFFNQRQSSLRSSSSNARSRSIVLSYDHDGKATERFSSAFKDTKTDSVVAGNDDDNVVVGGNFRGAFHPKEPLSESKATTTTRMDKNKKSSVMGDMKDVGALRAAFLESSGKEEAKQPDEQESKISDMADVSALRAAFLKSVQVDKERRNQEQQQQKSWTKAVNDSTWRLGGAQDFRKRVRERMQKDQQQHQQRNNKKRLGPHNNNAQFFGTRDDEQRRRRRHRRRAQQQRANEVMLPPRPLSVTELSTLFRVKINSLLGTLKSLGERPTNGEDHMVDVDTMELIALELGMEPIRSLRRTVHDQNDRDLLLQRRNTDDDDDDLYTDDVEDDSYASLASRPPVVCLMGHVDHGKTTLMDALRQRSKKQNKPKKSKKKKKQQGNAKKDQDAAVAGTEAGGITQVISAFQVSLLDQQQQDDDKAAAVTFLDTPGHAAFRAMRESGSHAADVIVLVVAADDGVSPQTVEIIEFFKSIVDGSGGGGISLVVAMTKIDKPGIDVAESMVRIENELMLHGIVPESMAGTTESEFGPPVQLIPVSGLTGEGVDDLIEGLALQSEVMDLRADANARAEGIVMDARLEKGLGIVADCIVRWGSLEYGDVVVSGTHMGIVKALKDGKSAAPNKHTMAENRALTCCAVGGATIKKAVPSQPVRVVGFRSIPKAGDPVICVASEDTAQRLVERRDAHRPTESTEFRSEDVDDSTEFQVTGVSAQQTSRLERIHAKYDIAMESSNDDDNNIDDDEEDSTIRIPIIVKADADGTLAALRESIMMIGHESKHNIVIDPIVASIGPITENEAKVAADSNAAIFTFNIKNADREVSGLLESEGVTHRSHNVIYSLLDEAKIVFAGYMPRSPVEHVHGQALVQAVFSINNKKDAEQVAGLRVLEGRLHKDTASDQACFYRVLRDGQQVVGKDETVTASSLRKFKDAVDEVRSGEECGLGLDGFHEFEQGDIIECYSVEMKKVFV